MPREKDPEIERQRQIDYLKARCTMKTFVGTSDMDLKRKPSTARVRSLEFGMLKTRDVLKSSHLRIENRNLYEMNSRVPMENGCLDPRMGTSNKGAICTTCGKGIQDCIGHFGHVKLILPVFHIGYVKETIRVLQSICKSCGRILLTPQQRTDFLKKLRHPDIDKRTRNFISKEQVLHRCKKVSTCPYCGAANGTVKKLAGAFKIVHDLAAKTKSRSDLFEECEMALSFNKEIKNHLHKAVDDLDPLTVQKLFNKVLDLDCELLNLSHERGRPEDMIIDTLTVPPVCLRPSVAMGTSGSNEDDLTVKIGDIVYINNYIKHAFEKGGQTAVIQENWDFLQQQVAMYFNSDLPGFPKMGVQSKPIRALTQRLKGKTGRFRGNLSGKRVDFSSRTVISPDPNLKVTQVGVPRRVAKILTFPETVTSTNINRLRRCVRNGPDVHPGANFIVFNSNGTKVFLKYGDRQKLARMLSFGDIVERHLDDEDIVLFNRQPSLHKMSIMAHRAKVLSWRTFRFNESVCAPYNADFDGDEMNMHLPQTQEARAEAITLMGVQQNLVTPRHGEPLVHPTQDFITTSFLVSQKDVFYSRNQFCRLCCYFNDGLERMELPPPAILKPIQLWTGKQIWNMILRPNKDKKWPLINLQLCAKNYNSKLGMKFMDPNDGYVHFRNSELMCGNLGKKCLGGKQDGLIYSLIRDWSTDIACEIMNRISKFSARFIGDRGFSIGIDDVTPTVSLNELKSELIDTGYTTCHNYITQWKAGELEAQPGCNEEQTLEALLLGELSQIREDAGSTCLNNLDRNFNAPLIMAVCGSKGSNINISQMVACVGQQAVGGSRIAEGFVNRTLPHFDYGSRIPEAKGFVSNSFFSGLTATEFFFHTMGGREGLVDTAVKTAETGYMQRRLVKALEDLCVFYDGSVRTSEKNVVQLVYGDDGLDPVMMVDGVQPVSFPRVWENVRAMGLEKAQNTMESAMTPEDMIAKKALVDHKSFNICSNRFREKLVHFIERKAIELHQQLITVGLRDPDAPLDLKRPVRKRTKIQSGTKMEIVKDEKQRGKRRRTVDAESSEDDSAYEDEGKQEVDMDDPIRDLSKEIEVDPHIDTESAEALIHNTMYISDAQFNEFLDICRLKYSRSIIEPGTAVGAIGAQSIGEPGTQMTLKTFHFAGVASMNVTLGVPRIKEIINAAKNISSPIITAPLINNTDVTSARIVKGRAEQTLLKDIAVHIETVYRRDNIYLSVKLDLEAIQTLQLNVDVRSVADAILAHKPLKLKGGVKTRSQDTIIISPNDAKKESMAYSLQLIAALLPDVVVCGINGVKRAVINDEGDGTYKLIVEGANFLDVMGVQGVDGLNTTCNHVIEVEKVLGIEAARYTIMKEIHTTMEGHGLSVDPRHVALLADVMSSRGEILGITRFGIAKMKESVLMLASFEKTADHLYEAAIRGSTDHIAGVSECIILGTPMPIGTGLFSLVQKVKQGHKPHVSDFQQTDLLIRRFESHHVSFI